MALTHTHLTIFFKLLITIGKVTPIAKIFPIASINVIKNLKKELSKINTYHLII